MTDQSFTEKVYTSDHVEENHQVTDSLLENPDHFVDQVPVETDLIVDAPMGGTMAAVDPMNAPFAGKSMTYEPVSVLTPSGEVVVDEPALDRTIPYAAVPLGEPIVPEATIDMNTGALLNREDSEHFRGRWNEIQGTFVDEPRSAVQQADGLVSEVIGQITEMFAHEHGSLEEQWNQGNDVSTEDLRKALQRYRSFFNRLVLPRAE